MAFTASALQRVQVRLAEMFANPSIATPELLQPAYTAKALLARQRSRTIERLESNKVTGIKAWYIRPNAATHANTAAPSDCTTPVGSQAGTLSADYDTTVLARTKAVVIDNRSDNLIEVSEEMTAQTAHMIAQLRLRLNQLVITELSSSAGENNDTLIKSGWDYLTNTPRITVPESEFTWENLNEFRIVGENNNFGPGFFFVSGRLFNDNVWMSGLNRANEGERNQALAWAQRQIYFDSRDLDQTIGRKTAFAVDPNCYAFWNTTRNSPTPTQLPGADDKWVYTVADPELLWNRNGVLVPVQYEFEVARTCSGRDSQDFQQTQYAMYGRCIGGFELCPAGPNGETGVLAFSNE